MADHAVGPGGNMLRRFSSRATIAEELPVRTFCADLSPGSALLFPIVPLDQVTIDFGNRPNPGQFIDQKARGLLP